MTPTKTTEKTLMKNNPKQGPDINSILSGLSQEAGSKVRNQGPTSQDKDTASSESTEHQERLWEEFLTTLNDDDDPEIERNKLYAIDEDIVETLHQCDFGKANVHVINSILRTFLIDNLPKLREMHRPRSISLLDKY